MVDARPSLTLGKLFRAAAARDGAADALRFGDATYTYGMLSARLARAGAVFATAGIRPGSVVLLASANRPEYFEVVLGAADVGAAVATINPRSTSLELAAICADCKPQLAIIDDVAAPLHMPLRDAGVTCVRLGTEWESLLSRASPNYLPPSISGEAAFAISYTSGTTGAPKGVMLSHRSRALTALAIAGEYGCFGAQDCFLAVTPLYHGAGFAYALTNLLFGGRVHLFAKAEIERIAAAMASPETTGVFLVPTLVQRLIGLPPHKMQRGANLKGVVCNASALAQPLKEAFVAAFGEGLLHETYGSTEAGIVTNLRPEDQLRTHNACGRHIFGVEVSIRAASGAELGPGETGELSSRGPYGYRGYLNGAPVDPDGWITSGDLAMRDAAGINHIVGRLKDVIITGGVNVYPREIESVLLAQVGVADAVALGVADSEWGERIEALVTLAPGAPPPGEEALIAACKAALSPHKTPRQIQFVDEIPRSAAGKLLRGQAAALHRDVSQGKGTPS
jgi:long-chain acyl-CoA synthetase